MNLYTEITRIEEHDRLSEDTTEHDLFDLFGISDQELEDALRARDHDLIYLLRTKG